jgi:predicted TIM-barrel fold metal-dependent hydrolase
VPVVDSHAHIFPALGGASGFDTVEGHRAALQWGVRQHVQPVLRRDDHAPVQRQTLVTGNRRGLSDLTTVGFEVGRYGRFEWEHEGEELYLQYMPPMLADMEAPAELLIALMDHAGVDRAVLQNDSVYGRLNAEFAAAVRQWPSRLISLATFDLLGGSSPSWHADELSRCMADGHRGLFVKLDDFFEVDFETTAFDPEYDPLWERAAQLGIPIYWQLVGFPEPDETSYIRTWRLFEKWLQRHGDISIVIVGGLPFTLVEGGRVPDFVLDAVRGHDVLLEVAFPIQIGGRYGYPFRETEDALRFLVREIGVQKLLWASDIPNIERYCTYRQSWEYLRSFAFLNQTDLDSILAANVSRLFPA